MNVVGLAKERCANWDEGRCLGWSVEALLNQGRGPVKALERCCLRDGERCDYFEQCVLSDIIRRHEDTNGLLHYRQTLERYRAQATPGPIDSKGS